MRGADHAAATAAASSTASSALTTLSDATDPRPGDVLWPDSRACVTKSRKGVSA